MSWFTAAFTQVKVAFKAGWTRLVQSVAAIARPQKPCTAPVLVPVPATLNKDDAGNAFAKISPPIPFDDLALSRCPRAGTPPLQQPCRTADVKRGSHAARALFHDPFKAPSRVGSFDVTSLATPTSDVTISFADDYLQSPTDTSRSDSQFTPILDSDTSQSPSISTAPTTPTSILSPTIVKGEFRKNVWESEPDEEDNVPLSALMIRGVRDATKRHALSGPILAGSKCDRPSWLSGLRPSRSCDETSSVVLEVIIHTPPDSPDSSNTSSPSVSGDPSDDSTSKATGRETKGRSNTPLGWWHAAKRNLNLEVDEVSVYSLESYSPSKTNSPAITEPLDPRQASVVPEITLTPPSQPTTPEMASNAAHEDAVSAFHGCETSDLDVGVSEDRPTAALDNALNPSLLLVPPNAELSECDRSESLESTDSATLKRRRRNACRVDTSSIDLIMAGLDQVFPESRCPSPTMSLEDPKGMSTGSSFPSADWESVGEVASEQDTSSNDGDRDQWESRFSDSSDDEDGFYGPTPLSNLDARRSGVSFPDPSSVLSTIAEEEERDSGSHPLLSESPRSCLEPSAIIDNLDMTAPTITKRRWFSMIDTDVVRNGGNRTTKTRHLSAPLLNPAPPRGIIVSASGLHWTFVDETEAGSLTSIVDKARRQSAVRPLVLPARSASRPSVTDLARPGVTGSCALTPPPERFPCTDTFENVPILEGLLPWALYTQSSSTSSHSSPVHSKRSSVSSVYSNLSVSGDSPIIPDSIVREFSVDSDSKADASIGLSSSTDDADALECEFILNTAASHPQGVNGILAILDALENSRSSLAYMRPTSYLSETSTRWSDARWSGVDFGEMDAEGRFAGGYAL
ncbi:hypothetical protein CC2G_007124 [Coprinopsis cinerea AmutBmut pab1-1]|nr:hypothetical protein CC2G_007124 [Coprinopsis cinerea AmutBmut pab1-1]